MLENSHFACTILTVIEKVKVIYPILIIASLVSIGIISVIAVNSQKEETPSPIKENQPEVVTQNEKNSPKQEILCEYKLTNSQKEIPIDQNDDIQKIIGYQNNKVGLYIYAEIKEFTDLAAEMVNANGGDWGYVLIPYNVKDRDETRWIELFDRLNKDHLIPIIQLWDLDLDNEERRDNQIKESAEFLHKQKWPIKNRYISVYNEPNSEDFWNGDINPEEYAVVLDKTIDTFNKLSPDYFMLNAGFNASARTGDGHLDEREFLIRMNTKVPGIFRKLDGWASHPYPQPNFSGSPKASGRDSIKAYEWELDLLKRYFGIDKENLPVFITETGWAHKESKAFDEGEPIQYPLDEHQVADNIRYAFENVWLKDEKVVAVTPFTIRYNPPHDNFSWITSNNNPYAQFDSIKDMGKEKGKPPIIEYFEVKEYVCEKIKTN